MSLRVRPRDISLRGSLHYACIRDTVKGFFEVDFHEDPRCESGNRVANVVNIDKEEAILGRQVLSEANLVWVQWNMGIEVPL